MEGLYSEDIGSFGCPSSLTLKFPYAQKGHYCIVKSFERSCFLQSVYAYTQ